MSYIKKGAMNRSFFYAYKNRFIYLGTTIADGNFNLNII